MRSGRRLSFAGFAAIVVADLALITLLSLAVDAPDAMPTAGSLASNLLIPTAGSAVFVWAVIAWLGWWRPVLADDRPVQRWVVAVPAVFVVCALGAIDYGELADRGLGFTLVLALIALLVGVSEEGLFRGIGVVTLRQRMPETRVALWSSVVFGAAHLVNALATGGGAIAQAVAVSFAGYFFYLTRRRTGGLPAPVLVHALFDFSILSGTVAGGPAHPGVALAILAYLVAGGLLLARRRHIERA